LIYNSTGCGTTAGAKVLGQNEMDYMSWTKWYGQNDTDRIMN